MHTFIVRSAQSAFNQVSMDKAVAYAAAQMVVEYYLKNKVEVMAAYGTDDEMDAVFKLAVDCRDDGDFMAIVNQRYTTQQ